MSVATNTAGARARAARQQHRKPVSIGRILSYVFLGFWTIVVVGPLYWMVTTAFKQQVDMTPVRLWIPWVQYTPKLDAFRYIYYDFWPQVSNAFTNSLIAAGGSAIAATLIGAFAGYGLVRFGYKFAWMRNDDLAFWFVSQRMLPPVVVVYPFLIMYRYAGLIDSVVGLVIAYTLFSLPITVWILRDAFRAVPLEIEESAWLDGASKFQSFFRIALPLVLPGLVAALLISFILAWNEYLFALMLTFQRAQTLPLLVGAQATQQGNYFWNMSALAMIAVVPILILGIALQGWIVRGLATGGVK